MKSIIIVAVLVLLTIGAYVFFRVRAKRRKSREPFVSMGYFLKAPRQLTEEDVRACASRAFGVTFDVGNPDATDFVLEAPGIPRRGTGAGHSQAFIIQVKEGTFILHSFPEPYWDHPDELAEDILDLRLRSVVAEHRAWLSVDALGDVRTEESKASAYRAIGKMMAELAQEDCLAIYCPELERCNEYDPQLLDVLCGDDPLALFGEPTFEPIVGVEADDPRMVAAVTEARQRWSEFAAAFQANTDNDKPFVIKANFSEGEKAEFMWVLVTRIAGETIYGTLENNPHDLTGVRKGQEVAVPLSELNDWLFVKDDELVGGFTIKAIEEMEQGR